MFQHEYKYGKVNKWYFSILLGFNKEIWNFQIWSYPKESKSGKKINFFIDLNRFLGNFEQYWKKVIFSP